MTGFRQEDLARLEDLHRRVDDLAATLAAALGERLVCRRGCCDCCQDDLTVFQIEAELIKARCGELLAGQDPAPAGRCAFLDGQGACRIYRWRPYVCRTQGLPLRWLDDESGNEEGRDICPLNRSALAELGEDVGGLSPDQCWTIGPWEGRLASLQAETSGRFEPVRIPLRSLFRNS